MIRSGFPAGAPGETEPQNLPRRHVWQPAGESTEPRARAGPFGSLSCFPMNGIPRSRAIRPARGAATSLAVAVLLVACEGQSVRPTPATTALPPQAAVSSSDPDYRERFAGQYRATAKTTPVYDEDGQLAPIENYADLETLRAYLQPVIDPLMRRAHPHLDGGDKRSGDERVAQERHNVAVSGYLRAVKHERGTHGDNDFHLMVCSRPEPGAGLCLTAEVSALPATGAQRPRLAQVREELHGIIGSCGCDGRFRRIAPAIPVRVIGSLFFDGAHAIGSVGPTYAKPFSVWEIHPILAITRGEPGR